MSCCIVEAHNETKNTLDLAEIIKWELAHLFIDLFLWFVIYFTNPLINQVLHEQTCIGKDPDHQYKLKSSQIWGGWWGVKVRTHLRILQYLRVI